MQFLIPQRMSDIGCTRCTARASLLMCLSTDPTLSLVACPQKADSEPVRHVTTQVLWLDPPKRHVSNLVAIVNGNGQPRWSQRTVVHCGHGEHRLQRLVDCERLIRSDPEWHWRGIFERRERRNKQCFVIAKEKCTAFDRLDRSLIFIPVYSWRARFNDLHQIERCPDLLRPVEQRLSFIASEVTVPVNNHPFTGE